MPNNPNAVKNLKPIKKGEVRNPKGRAKGSKNLATIIKELESEDFDWSLIPTKQSDAVKKLGSPWRAIVYSAVGQSLAGDTKAMKWLKESGYGNSLDLTTNGESINLPTIRIIDERNTDTSGTS